MLKKLAVVALVAALSGSVFAGDIVRREAKQVVELKDGSTLYIFRDGKMAVEDQYGNTKSVNPNTELESKDGQRFRMEGNEVGRLEQLKTQERIY